MCYAVFSERDDHHPVTTESISHKTHFRCLLRNLKPFSTPLNAITANPLAVPPFLRPLFIGRSYLARPAAMASDCGARPSSPYRAASALFQMDCFENDAFIRLSLELPGVAAKDINVCVQRGVLLVKGLRKTTHFHGEAVYTKHHRFARRFAIDTDVVDLQRMKANIANGVLTIQAPKKRGPASFCIPVTEGEESSDTEIREGAEADNDVTATPSCMTLAASRLPNVVSGDEIHEAATVLKTISVKRKHRSTGLSSQLRRSMRNQASA